MSRINEKWYHRITLPDGTVTPGLKSLVAQWEMMRRVRAGIEYRGKSVLDIASYDGMWAFEAEKLGATTVVATDCIHLPAYLNMLWAREQLGSSVIPFYNCAPHNVFDRLDVFFDDWGERFQIAQHLGLLYHLRDPMLSLAQTRSCLVDGGLLWMETAVALYPDQKSAMILNQNRVYVDHTTWWLPTIECLIEMLENTLFEVDRDSIQTMVQKEGVGRCCLIARARSVDETRVGDREIWRESRNPGLNLWRRWMSLP